jgi:hypothetical protein
MMPLQCNIDAKGKVVRLIWGVLLLIGGALLLVLWPLRDGGAVAWTVSIVVMLGGAFAIFESRAGWCVVRALGFKTRI